MDKQTQLTRILHDLKHGFSLTPLQALEHYGCFRLGARIHDLKKQGYVIKSEMVTQNGKRFARYSLEG